MNLDWVNDLANGAQSAEQLAAQQAQEAEAHRAQQLAAELAHQAEAQRAQHLAALQAQHAEAQRAQQLAALQARQAEAQRAQQLAAFQAQQAEAQRAQQLAAFQAQQAEAQRAQLPASPRPAVPPAPVFGMGDGVAVVPGPSGAPAFGVTRARLVITSPFGMRRHPVTGEEKFHNGVDFGLVEGTPLLAPIAGQIQFWQDEHNGNALAITGQIGGVPVRVSMSHLKAFVQLSSPLVRAGQPIGWSGNTGRSTGPHLHLSVSWGGQPVDPLKVLDLSGFDIVRG